MPRRKLTHRICCIRTSVVRLLQDKSHLTGRPSPLPFRSTSDRRQKCRLPSEAGDWGGQQYHEGRDGIDRHRARAGTGNVHQARSADSERRERPERIERGDRAGNGKKTPPPDQTHAENFYYQKQMQAKTPMVVVLHDGEEIHGMIEWYDRTCLKLIRSGSSPNVLVYKSCIKYMFKESESGNNGRR
jgi:host factor-I protein